MKHSGEVMKLLLVVDIYIGAIDISRQMNITSTRRGWHAFVMMSTIIDYL